MAINKLCSVISVAVATILSMFLLPVRSLAHPMGNFSINHFSAIAVYPRTVRVTYIIDMAEIPTFQEIQDSGLVAQPDGPSAVQYRGSQSGGVATGTETARRRTNFDPSFSFK